MISINDAVKQGISKLRLPNWADKRDHIELTILKHPDGSGANHLGPWYKFWSETNELIGTPNPYMAMTVGPTALGDLSAPIWEIYNADT